MRFESATTGVLIINPPLRFEKLGIFLWFLFFWSSGRKISQRFLFFSKKIRLRRVFIFTFSQNESIFSQNSRFCLKKHLKNFRLRRAISKNFRLRRVFIFIRFFKSENFRRFLIFSKNSEFDLRGF